MYAVVYTHIDFAGIDENNTKVQIMSRHRSRENAIKKMVKMIPSFYGWQKEEEFDEEFPEDRAKAAQEGKYVVRDEEWGEWGDCWAVLEL